MVVVSGNGTAVTGLGGVSGYGEIMLSRADDASLRVNVGAVFENGFQFGAEHFAADELFVSTNGLISFGAAVNGVQASLAAITRPFIAAFHADVDTRLDGEGPESGPVWVDIDPAADVVTITWQDVGYYRRNASLTNTFQLQLYDLGADGIAIVLRYEEVAWVSGDLQGGWQGLGGDPALIGWRLSSSGAVTGQWASGDEGRLLGLPDGLGNTGVAGLWVQEYLTPRVISGASANETLTGGAGSDVIYGGSGNDALRGLGGPDALHGDTGFDLADYSQAATAVVVHLADPAANSGLDAAGDSYFSIEGVAGGGFDDQLTGTDAANLLRGGAGNDRLQAGGGNDTVYGGQGDDTLFAGGGADRYYGDGGRDRVDYAGATAGITVDRALPGQSTGIAAGDRFYGIEEIAGSGFGDRLSGWLHADRFFGGDGDDRLSGRGGEDQLFGDAGRDTLVGGSGADSLNGGAGRDLAGYGGAATAIVADLAEPALNLGAEAAGDRYVSIEDLYGSRFGDSLAGDATANWLAGAAGHDTLVGRGGDDSLIGGAGNDVLEGGSGADVVMGGAGEDRASYAGATSGVVADLARPDVNSGEALGDVFAGIEGLIGSALDDRLAGEDAANVLLGGAGNDILQGRGGADRLYGGSGLDLASYEGAAQGVRADLGLAARNSGEAAGDVYVEIEGLRGSAQADELAGDHRANLLEGGGGSDLLTGGAGADSFVLRSLGEAGDFVTDYRPAEGDSLEIAVSGVMRSALDVRYQTIAGQGQPGLAEALIVYRPTGQVLFTLADAAGLAEIFVRIGTTSYDLV